METRQTVARKPFVACLGVSLAVVATRWPRPCRSRSWLWPAVSQGSGGEGSGARLARLVSRPLQLAVGPPDQCQLQPSPEALFALFQNALLLPSFSELPVP